VLAESVTEPPEQKVVPPPAVIVAEGAVPTVTETADDVVVQLFDVIVAV
jgi:hypothetical protein